MNDRMEDINVINGVPTTWIDSQDPGVPATGWVAWYAYGINTSGEIVGKAVNAAEGISRVFLFSEFDSPRFLLLPPIGPGWYRGSAINDSGTIVGIREAPGVVSAITYRWNPETGYTPIDLDIPTDLSGKGVDINDNGRMIIAGYDNSLGYRAIRLTPTGQGDYTREENFPGGLRPSAINEHGGFAGQEWSRRKSGFSETASFRYTNENGLEIIKQRNNTWDYAFDINSSGDVCISSDRAYLLWENDPSISEDNVLASLDELVVGTSGDLALWHERSRPLPWAINMRDGSGFG
jgi:hypothetical protein